MNLSLDPATFRDLLTDPGGAESLSAAAGTSLVVVAVDDAATARALEDLDITAIPSVVVVVAEDAKALPAAAFGAADVILTEDPDALAPFVTPADGVAACLDRMATVLEANPVAGASLALLLRMSVRLGVPAALVAESAAYSALQDGAEFRRWRAGCPARPREPVEAHDQTTSDLTSGSPDRIRVIRAGDELRITLSRPGRRNAVDWRMRDALTAALTVAVRDLGCRVVLRGAGPDFCAGGDLDEFGSRPDPAIAHLTRLTRSPARLLHELSLRTTAYVHGSCLGAGIELPAFAHRVVAAENSRFGLPEIGLGLIPGAGGTVSLPRRIGRWRTAYLGLSGQVIGAQEALTWGLVDSIGPEPAS